MTPHYEHNCKNCRYIHSVRVYAPHAEDEIIDWYVCEGNDPSVVGRYHDEGSGYWSLPADMVAAIVAERERYPTTELNFMTVLAYAALTLHRERSTS